MSAASVAGLELRAAFDEAKYQASRGCKWAKRIAPKLKARLRDRDRRALRDELRQMAKEIRDER